MVNNSKNIFVNILNYFTNSVVVVLCILIVRVLFQIFLFSSFHIPSDSMEPELIKGDVVVVWKPMIGARLFDLNTSLNLKPVDIYRLPGIRAVRHNDVLVFNCPYPNNREKLELHVLKYYIKRCVGLPGDTLTIVDGIIKVNAHKQITTNISHKVKIMNALPHIAAQREFQSFPHDSIIGWTTMNFGPLYIPKAGKCITMNQMNFIIYRKLIEWEQKGGLQYRDSIVYLNGKQIDTYCFSKNYYFMVGDKRGNSLDSRNWGLLPEEYIVGKAAFVWKTIDPYTGNVQWDRFLKIIH